MGHTSLDRLKMATRAWDLMPSPLGHPKRVGLQAAKAFHVHPLSGAGVFKAAFIQSLSSEWSDPSRLHTKPQAPRGIAPTHEEPLDHRFLRLVTQWEQDTAFTSSAHEFILHPAYLEIIGMGLRALTLIFERLPGSPAPWFPALRASSRQASGSASLERT